ncbi:MAG: hypothetical protein IJZ42_13100 [Lachnospiraceae bacterium]|nr:hypothetical protein [Lachnospiraceae bacterium]
MKRIICLMAVLLMLICSVSCVRTPDFSDDEVELYSSNSTTETVEEAEGENDTSTAGIVVMCVSGLGIVGGVVLKVIQKKRK